MKVCQTGFLSLAFSGLAALLLGQIGLAQRLEAAPPNPFARPTQNLKRTPTPAMQYFGGQLPRTTARQGLHRLLPDPRPLQLQGLKPFESLQHSPALSPYNNLNTLGLPNYYAFVKPLQDQRKANRRQAANLRRLQQKLRTATATGVVSSNPTGGVPTTGHSSQFLNLGGYFSGVQ